MSHTIPISDDLYTVLTAIAQRERRPVEDLIEEYLTQLVRSETTMPGRLDWDTASAEEIIEQIKAFRVDRDEPAEL